MIDLTKLTNREVLALTIIGEARGERIEGQVAVGSIIRNRLSSNTAKYPDYSAVCLEDRQFSCWNAGDVNRPYLVELAAKMFIGDTPRDPYLRQCIVVANGIIDFDILDNTNHGLYYLENRLFNNSRPKWAFKAKNIMVIGNQTFFSV